MAEAKFDPYHAWLGIPAWDRPVNAYRLLGVEVFEQNRKVIEAAANRQMAYLQELSSGDEHIEEAQKLLGQISRARVVLLNPEKKTAYDKKLDAQLDSLPDTEGGSSLPTKIPTHSSAAVTLAKKKKGFNRLALFRKVLIGVISALIILSALLFRPKGVIVRTYDDQNDNQVYDPGEEVENVYVVKFFIDKEKIDDYSYDTDKAGQVTLKGISKGPIGFIVDPPYEFSSADNKLYYEASVDTGPRFFSQVVDIPVRKRARPVASLSPQAAPPNTNVAQEINQSDAPTDEISPSVNFTLHGHIFTLDEEGAPQGWEAPWYIDLDGNEIRLKGKEPSLTLNPQGRYEIIVPIEEINDETVLRPLVLPDDYEDPGGIALSLDDIRDGELIIATEMKRKPISYQGMLSVEPEGESPEGFIVYLDKNQNEQRDEDELQSQTDAEGSYQIQSEWFNNFMVTGILRIEVDPDTYGLPQLLSREGFDQKLPSITSKNNNFKITKNNVSDETEIVEQNVDTAPTLESDPSAFLRSLGFDGTLPIDTNEEKPEWTFQTNKELVTNFTTAKREYDKAAKKQNWGKILELEAARKNNDAEIKDILTNAKTEAAKTRAQQKVLPYNKANTNINVELSPLKESRDALKDALVMAAQAVEQQHQQYQAALDDTEGVKTAATALGVSIQPLTKKQQVAWQPALQFLAERELVRLGLQKQSRRWVPTGVAIEADGFRQIKMFAQQHFQDYVSKKDQLTALINQNQSSMKSQIDKLEKDLDYQTRAPRYKNAKKEFDRMTKIYLEHLDTLQTQRAEIESKKKAIEKILGGAKKYKAIINQYPKDEVIFKKHKIIRRLQEKVQ